jgi:hypothetical protein
VNPYVTDLRVRRAGEAEPEEFDFGERGEELALVANAISHVVDCLDSGVEPEIAAERALDATGLTFGVWESARRRARIEFPLDIEDNPLEAMVAAGDLTPK